MGDEENLLDEDELIRSFKEIKVDDRDIEMDMLVLPFLLVIVLKKGFDVFIK